MLPCQLLGSPNFGGVHRVENELWVDTFSLPQTMMGTALRRSHCRDTQMSTHACLGVGVSVHVYMPVYEYQHVYLYVRYVRIF